MAVPSHAGSPLATVEAAIPHEVRLTTLVRKPLSSPGPPRAAYLEDVGIVRVEVHRDRHIDAIEAIVGDLNPFDTACVPQHPRPADVDLAARDRDHAVATKIRIGQVRLEHRVVGGDD